jgi:hypothetical protein
MKWWQYMDSQMSVYDPSTCRGIGHSTSLALLNTLGTPQHLANYNNQREPSHRARLSRSHSRSSLRSLSSGTSRASCPSPSPSPRRLNMVILPRRCRHSVRDTCLRPGYHRPTRRSSHRIRCAGVIQRLSPIRREVVWPVERAGVCRRSCKFQLRAIILTQDTPTGVPLYRCTVQCGRGEPLVRAHICGDRIRACLVHPGSHQSARPEEQRIAGDIRRQARANLAASTGGVLIGELNYRHRATIRDARVVLHLRFDHRPQHLSQVAGTPRGSIIRRRPEWNRLGGGGTLGKVCCHQLSVFAGVCLQTVRRSGR